MQYKYVAYDKNGKKIKGTVEAASIEDAKNRLRDLIVIEIKEPRYTLNITISKKISKKALARYFHILGLYLRASIPIVTALQLTKEQLEDSRLITLSDQLQQNIKEGKTLYQAMESQKILAFPFYILNSIKIGEESGKLDRILIELSHYLKEEDRILSKTKQAFIYPSFIVAVSIAMISFILTFVVPKIVKVFESLNQELPGITLFVIHAGDFIKHHALAIGGGLLFTLATFSLIYKKNRAFRYLIDSFTLHLPVVKKLILSKELGRLSYLIHTLTDSGITYVQAVKLATQTIDNEKIRSIFEKALKDVMEGKKLSVSLQKNGFTYDRSFLQAIALAEETSQVEEILKNLSEIYFEENENTINTLLALLEPTLIILVGGAIGFIVTALLLPIFSMNILH